MSSTHDPSEYIKGLLQILASDKKQIGFLFGAGTSLSNAHIDITIPVISQLTDQIVSHFDDNLVYKNALSEIKTELGEKQFTIEQILSNLESKKLLVSLGKLNGLTKAELEELIQQIKDKIHDSVSIHKKFLEDKTKSIIDTVHYKFAQWIGRVSRKNPIEIFTTNYDFLFELGLEEAQVPFYDGFSGSFEPFFCPETVDDIQVYPKLTKLWKLHGSLGWDYNEAKGRVIKKGHSEGKLLIYPSHLKYHDSRKQPYVSLIDRLYSFLQRPDSILITCGYSFGDEHINERIISSLRRSDCSHVFGFLFDKNSSGRASLTDKDNELRKLAENCSRVSAYGMRSAVIGCKYGEWKLKNEPSKEDTPQVNTYFDEDFSVKAEVGTEGKGDEIWSGTGVFLLSDFSKLIIFLENMMTSTSIDGEIK